MALIKCPECGKKISNTAKICPNCGYSNTQAKKANKVPFIMSILSFIFSCTFFIHISGELFSIIYLIMGVTGLVFNRSKVYLIIAGMFYIVFAFLALIGSVNSKFLIYVMLVNIVYAGTFLLQGLRKGSKLLP